MLTKLREKLNIRHILRPLKTKWITRSTPPATTMPATQGSISSPPRIRLDRVHKPRNRNAARERLLQARAQKAKCQKVRRNSWNGWEGAKMSVRGYSAEGRPRLLHTVEYSWRTVSETSVVGGEVSEGRVREWKEEYLRGSEGRYKEKKDREVEKEKEKVERKEEENEVKVRIKDNKRDKTEDVQREATDSVHTLPPQVTIGVQEEDEEKDGVEDSQRTPAESLHTMSQHDAAEEEEAEEKLHEEAWEDEEIGATLTRQSNSNYHDSSTVVDPMKRVYGPPRSQLLPTTFDPPPQSTELSPFDEEFTLNLNEEYPIRLTGTNFRTWSENINAKTRAFWGLDTRSAKTEGSDSTGGVGATEGRDTNLEGMRVAPDGDDVPTVADVPELSGSPASSVLHPGDTLEQDALSTTESLPLAEFPVKFPVHIRKPEAPH